MALITQKEDFMKNNLKTAQEEKKMLDQIHKMKATLKYLPAIEKLNEQKDEIYKKFKEIRDKAKAVQTKISKEKAEMDKLKQKLNENKEEEEKNKKEETELDENGQPVKKKRPLTKEEQDIENKIQKIKAEIDELYKKKTERRDRQNEEFKEYEVKKFEKVKAEFTLKIIERLKREQKKKEWEERQKKFREEEEKFEKERLKTKYQVEIHLCETLINDMKNLKPENNKNEGADGQNEPQSLDFNLENSEFKSENVTLLIGKQNKFGEETVERKKKDKRKKPKKVKKAVITDKSKLQVDLSKIQQFDKLKILPPNTYAAIDDTIKELEEKREFFLKKREEEIKNAESEVKQDKEEKNEEKPDKRESKKQKKVEMTQEDFPEL